ncbi:MAG: PA domain-containing protein [Pseudonocardia sp.]
MSPRRHLPRAPLAATLALSAAALAAAALVVAVPGTAAAHPGHGAGEGELFAGEGIRTAKQPPVDEGNLPAEITGGVRLVGKAPVANPAGLRGRVADVAAFGDFAYLNAFRDPTCERGGVHVMDISDPANPAEVPDAFIPTSPGSYAGEGIQVIAPVHPAYRGVLLVHQNETCDGSQAVDRTQLGGISLWDVTDPLDPQPLARHVGDVTDELGGTERSPNTVHSMRVWIDERTSRTYAVLVDNEERTDVDIMDISDPRRPVMVNDSLDLAARFGVEQPDPAGLTRVNSHDMDVYRIGDRYVMTMNYWDGGYVLLDVTDPRAVSMIAESDFPAVDEQRALAGEQVAPEGNAHQAELSPDRRFMIGTDEDFEPIRVTATIDGGRYPGTTFVTEQARDTPLISQSRTATGPVTYLGQACDPAAIPRGSGTALVERGTCPFQLKLDHLAAAGYTAGIVFNAPGAECAATFGMIADGAVPLLAVGRPAGLRLLDLPGVTDENACDMPAPGEVAQGAAATVRGEFDGWGYVRLFRTDIPAARDTPGSLTQVGTWAHPLAQNPGFATGYGDLSVHEVAMDPDRQGIAYLSYYAAGLRVVEYGDGGLREIGSFVDRGGNNFWGVEVWRDETGKKYVLASDRDYGLYVFDVGA